MDRPLSIGDTITFTPSDLISLMHGATWKITLLDVKKGSEANSMMKNQNQYTSPSLSTDDFLLAKFRIEVVDSAVQDGSYDILQPDIRAVSPDGSQDYQIYAWPSYYQPCITNIMYKKGDRVEGWVSLEAPKGVTNPYIVFKDSKGSIWFRT